jgi:retinol-binding protein 3
MMITGAGAELIQALQKELKERYIFPEVAARMAEAIRTRLANGEYTEATSLPTLCETLTADLQAISRDKHLRLYYRAEAVPVRAQRGPTPEFLEQYRQEMLLENGGFRKVERLKGNVGYLEFTGFHHPDFAGDVAVAAMNFLANTSALIVDLRRNGGGHPGMVALVTSYLFDKPVHLNSLYWREQDRTEQYWTLPYVPGRRFGGEKPVWVLTSARTFSAAEEFTYNLKARQRATIVGELTGGGAHPGSTVRLHDHVEVFIPGGRAINPVTGTNWEGTGVEPDLAVPKEQALDVAYAEALRQVIARAGDAPSGPLKELVAEAQEALAGVQSRIG